MPPLIDMRDAEMMHRALLCIEDVETEFGLFCIGAHAMLLSLLGNYVDRQKTYEMDMRKDFPLFCSVANVLYDWFDTAKRKQAIEAELLQANHKIGEQVLRTVRKVREEDGRKARGGKEGEE